MRIFDFDPALRAVSQFLNTTNNRYEGVALITKLERLDFEASDFSPAATKSVLRTDSGSLVLSPEHAKQLDELLGEIEQWPGKAITLSIVAWTGRSRSGEKYVISSAD